ncbi:MAG: C-type lectin domain-containing protein [Fimbriimonadaceae bacterium]|nr:C-type lectin domain-containing protein [Fimbriimonadaceae bacterium]
MSDPRRPPPQVTGPEQLPAEFAGRLPAGTALHQALSQVADDLRREQRVPPDSFLCGLADGSLRQLLPPVAAEVSRRTRDSALARLEVSRYWAVMTPYERLRALWRRVPLRARLLLALLCCCAAAVAGVDAVECHRQRTARRWQRYPGNAHWYFLGGTHDSLADVARYGRRYGAQPAVVDDPGEHRWLASQFVLPLLPRSAKQPPALPVLLGYREQRRGLWLTSNGTPLRFTRWAPGEPSPQAREFSRVVVWEAATGWRAVPPPTGGPGSPSLLVLFEHVGDPYAWTLRELTAAPLLLLLGLWLLVHATAVLAARSRLRVQLDLRSRDLDDLLRPEPRSASLEPRW